MREALASILLLVVIGMGWKESYSSRISRFQAETPGETDGESGVKGRPGGPGNHQRSLRIAPQAAAPDRSWMFERTKLDSPHGAKQKPIPCLSH